MTEKCTRKWSLYLDRKKKKNFFFSFSEVKWVAKCTVCANVYFWPLTKFFHHDVHQVSLADILSLWSLASFSYFVPVIVGIYMAVTLPFVYILFKQSLFKLVSCGDLLVATNSHYLWRGNVIIANFHWNSPLQLSHICGNLLMMADLFEVKSALVLLRTCN